MTAKGDANYSWLPQEDYDKAIGQARLQIGAILQLFAIQGMDVYIPETVEAIMQVVEAFGERVRGKDKPIIAKARWLE